MNFLFVCTSGAVVKVLLQQPNIDVNATDDAGNTALHWLSAQGILSILLDLVESKCELNCQNNCGVTALHRACNNGQGVFVQKLGLGHLYPSFAGCLTFYVTYS